MKIWPVGDELDETDRQPDMTKLLATYSKLQTRLRCKSYEAIQHAAVSKPLAHVTCYFQISSPAQYKIFKKRLYKIWCYFDRASPLICGNKMPTRFNRGFYCRSYCLLNMFGHHYAPHQELKSIIRWLLHVVFGAVVFKLLVWCGAEGYVSGLQDVILLGSWWWA